MRNGQIVPRVILGVGTGRCGTLSLTRLLNRQAGVLVTHERPPYLPWNCENPRDLVTARLNAIRADSPGAVIGGDVAFFYLNYLQDALELDGQLRVVCLRRPKHEVVASYRRWISCRSGPHVNHWAPTGNGWCHDPVWTPCYPQYDTSDMNEGVRRFWDEYHQTTGQAATDFPGRVAVFDMHAALNTVAEQRELLEFVGVPHQRQVLCLQDRIHQSFSDQSALPPLASIVATCKGRLHHLQQALPTMLAQRCPFPYEIVVVDYGCPQQTYQWCQSLNLQQLVTVRVRDNTERFNLARARNCGAAVALGKVLAFVDADMRLHPSWLSVAAEPILARRAGLTRVVQQTQRWDRCGTCAVSTELYHRVRGYDEAVQGWGPEDKDFYRRVTDLAPESRFAGFLLDPITHDDRQRVQHYGDMSIQDSDQRNKQYLQTRAGPVNPQGYGAGHFDVFQGVSPTTAAEPVQQPSRIRRGIKYRTQIPR
jgi:hypothetical protein